MKNFIAFLFYCLSVTALVGQGSEQTSLSVLQKSLTATTLEFKLGGIVKQTLKTPNGEAVTVQFEGGTPLLQAGAPDIAKYALAIQLPATGNAQVEILAGEYQDFENVRVAPSKGDLKRNVNPASVPFVYGPAYQRDAFFPADIAELQTPFIMRELRGQALWIYPVQYNPVSMVLRVYSSITVQVKAIGGTGINELDGSRELPESPAFTDVYEKLFVNYEGISSRGPVTPEKMLVIAKDEFVAELEPFVTWKRQMGIHTSVVTLSEVGASDAQSIFNFVKNYYEQHAITYLLLVGSTESIAPQMRESGGTMYACDNCFGYMSGDDHLPEVMVGRFHAASVDELRLMVARNLDYEKTPLVDTVQNWCGTALAACSNEGEGFGDDGQADWQHGNEWKIKHLADGYDKYWEFYDSDHSADSPTPGDISADQPGDPINTSIVTLMNGRGISLYNYTGHGWEQGLASGNFNTDAVALLRNNHRYPIIVAVACCAGNFSLPGDCLGEAMQRAGNVASNEAWGGIGGFYSSDFQSWSPPMEGQDGMNQFLVDADGIAVRPSISSMALYGNSLMIVAYNEGGEAMADFWNPFHEPSFLPRTKLPQNITASYSPAAIIGTGSLSVSCPVEGALVALYWQGQTLATATVNGGLADLQFPALNTVGDLVVTITQFNYTPHQGIITVSPASGPFVVNQAIVLDDSFSGNNNQKADYGETLNMNLTLANLGVALADSVKTTLSTLDLNVTITDDTEDFGVLDPGAALEKTAAFSFFVNSLVNDGHVVLFDLLIEFSNGMTFTAQIPVVLQAPKLGVGNLVINDFPGGDGDGRLESGETATISIQNANTGHSKSPFAEGLLTASTPWLSISPAISLGQLAAGSASPDAQFTVTVAADAPDVITTEFYYTLSAGVYEASKTFGLYVINPILETFESHNFEAYPWEMGGNKPWVISSSNAYVGEYCSRSGSIAHNQSSEMRFVLDFTQDGTVSFARRVSSEPDFDFLNFYIDGNLMDQWSGEVAWGEVSYPISAGTHMLSWVYKKDDAAIGGTDRAWVDEISMPPYQVVVGTRNLDANTLSAALLPNPVGDHTWLRLNLPEAQTLQVDAFDCSGALVRQFTSFGNLLSGNYDVPMDFIGLLPGVYYLRVKGNTQSATLRMVKL